MSSAPLMTFRYPSGATTFRVCEIVPDVGSLLDQAADIQEHHARGMSAQGERGSASRAVRLAAKERGLAEAERARADAQRRKAAAHRPLAD